MINQIKKDYIAQFLPNNPVIIEAGAHIGRDTKKMRQQWPHAQIHAFEPVPALFNELKNTVKNVAKIHCYPYALSNITGRSIFHVSSGRSTATSSLLQPKEYLLEHPTTTFHSIEVETITLDDWAAKYTIDHVDFLWFDMQGNELNALKGGTKTLESVRVIYTEVSLTERYEHNPLYPTIRSWLTEHGFSVEREDLRTASWGNVLFIRK